MNTSFRFVFLLTSEHWTKYRKRKRNIYVYVVCFKFIQTLRVLNVFLYDLLYSYYLCMLKIALYTSMTRMFLKDLSFSEFSILYRIYTIHNILATFKYV